MSGNTRNHRAAWAAACLLGVIPAVGPPVHADDDERNRVVLTSGNRMTGEIIKMTRGKLSFLVDGAGPVSIDWKNVVRLGSEQLLDVELESGRRLSGSISSPAGGALEVSGEPASGRIELGDVVRITPIAATFAERTDGYIDLGFDFLSAGDELDLTLNATLENRTLNYLGKVSLESLVRRLDDETSQRRNFFEGSLRRFLPDRWFVIGRFSAEEDRELDLDSRFLLGAGGGRTLLQSNRTTVGLYGGLDYMREQYAGRPGTDSSTEAFVTVEWDWFEIGGDVELLLDVTGYFGLDQSRTRFDLGASLRREMFWNLYWSFNLYRLYDSDPPEGLEDSDTGLSFTLGRGF